MPTQDTAQMEEDLLARLLSNNPERTIQTVSECAWGHYYTPAPNENPDKTDEGLRVLIFGSWTLGMLAFETVQELENLHPEKVNIVGLVTDDPLDPAARISKLKRFWRYYQPQRQEMYLLDLAEEALKHGTPCCTSEIKSDSFRKCLEQWNPDAIIVSAFGQRIDKPIIEFPEYGIYNVHPADLLHGFGAGAQPWEDLIERKAETTRLTIHKVTEEIDSGSVVGFSPELNVRLDHGKCTDDICLIGEKTLIPTKRMVMELVMQLYGRKQSGCSGPIDSMDFQTCFTAAEKNILMQPIHPEQRGHILPLSPEHARDTV